MSNTVKAPDNTLTAHSIKLNNSKQGNIGKVLSETQGSFKFSIWLKGKGVVQIKLQEYGGDSTNYKILSISLTPEWKKHFIECKKENDKNHIIGKIGKIRLEDNVSFWKAELEKI